MAFWVYVRRCVDGSFYTGHTDNLEQRIAQHLQGAFGGYTASRLPVKLTWSASASTRAEALEFERRIKGWSRQKKQALIDGRWDLLPELSRTSPPPTP